MLKKKIVIVATLIALPAFASRFSAEARGDLLAGFGGDAAALERGMKAAERTMAEDPGAAGEAMAWHGSGLLFTAGSKFRSGDVAEGTRLWEQAVAEMTRASAEDPKNPAILIPRAAVWFASARFSPPEMGKPLIVKALADYETVYAAQAPRFDKLGMHDRSELLFGLADGYSRLGNTPKAREWFEKLAALGAASGHAEQARLFLEGKPYEVKGLGCVGCHIGN